MTAGNAAKTASSILSRVKKPTEAEARAISQYFSTPNREKKRPFDPLADSVVEPQKKKKKRAIPTHVKKAAVPVKRGKPTNMKVFMLDKNQRKVPKGEDRKRLERRDQVQTVKIYRGMNSDELKEAILNTFKWLRSYTILACQSGGTSLVVNDNQHLSGEEMVKRRGPLYLAIEDSEDYVVSMRDGV